MWKMDGSRHDMLVNKMAISLDMLSSLIKNLICSYLYCNCIVSIEQSRTNRVELQVHEEDGVARSLHHSWKT